MSRRMNSLPRLLEIQATVELAAELKLHASRLGISDQEAARQMGISAATYCRLGQAAKAPALGVYLRAKQWLSQSDDDCDALANGRLT